MPSLNIVILMGNLTRDPELRYTPGGTAVCDLGLAVNRKVKGKDGEWREEADFLSITTWAHQAELCKQYLRRGSPVLIEGRARYEQWSDKRTGEQRGKVSIVAERVQFLGGGARGESEQSAGAGPAAAQRPAPPRRQAQSMAPPPAPPARPSQAELIPAAAAEQGASYEDVVNDSQDDIPF